MKSPLAVAELTIRRNCLQTFLCENKHKANSESVYVHLQAKKMFWVFYVTDIFLCIICFRIIFCERRKKNGFISHFLSQIERVVVKVSFFFFSRIIVCLNLKPQHPPVSVLQNCFVTKIWVVHFVHLTSFFLFSFAP